MNKIIVFANQKGGAGKSTLCTFFANYLAWKNQKVCIIDTDLQQTITALRKDDLEFYGCEPPYPIQGFPVADPEDMQQLMENAKDFDGYVLIDTPGNLNQDGLLPILINTDYIVCPFRYDKPTVSSTGTFIKTLRKVREKFPAMKAKLLFAPNNINRKGNLEEKKAWKQSANLFEMFGEVLPVVPSRAALERVNTIEIISSQRELVQDCFEKIIKLTSE